MVRKRGGDNIFERNKWKRPSTEPNTVSSNPEEKNSLNDMMLSLYRQDIKKLKTDNTSFENDDGNNTPTKKMTKDSVEIVTTQKSQTEQPKRIEDVKTPSNGPKKPKKSNKAITLKYSSINFDDVRGIDHILKDIIHMCMHFKAPQLYQKLKVPPVRGFLLHGPPGCGKTHLARAIAGELEVPFIEVAATEFVCGISGESESKIRDTFEEAINIGRCILFIDEIDAISPKRENANGGMERRMVAQMLKCLDELNEKDASSNVMVIGATNIPDSIDPALRRGGRFDKELAIGIPDENSRLRILQLLCKELHLESNFDLKWIAHHTPGFVGADLKSLVSKACEIGMWRIHFELYQQNSAGPKVISTEKNSDSNDKQELNEIRSWFKTLSIPEDEIEKLNFKLEDFRTALRNCVPYCKREGFALVPNTTWEDVGALENVKEQLRATVLRPVMYKKFYEENHLSSTKGILLYGPKGCGKTLLAKAIANECNINFLCINGPELLSMYLGESEKAVRQCFERARHSAPCVIFFDEFDALCPSRSKSHSNAAAERVVNQLLTEMDGVQERKQVFVIAATNRIEKIDSAMLRPGRLEKLIYVGIPSCNGRVEILRSLTKNKTRPTIAEDLSLETIASDERCKNFSGADLAYLIREATNKALDEIMGSDDNLSNAKLVLDTNHFNKALNVIQPSFNEQDQKYFEKYQLQPLGSE